MRTHPVSEPDGSGYWVANAHGWWGPYELSDLAHLDQPEPGEIVWAVGGGSRVELGPLVTWADR